MGGVGGLSGWQWLFMLEGLPSVAIGIVAFRVFPETPAEARWLTASEKASVHADLAADCSDRQAAPAASWRSIFCMPAFAALAVSSFALMTSTGGAFLWLPTILRNAGINSVLDIGFYSAIPFFFAAAAQYFIARHSDKMQERRLHVVIPFALSGVGWLLAATFRDDPPMAIAAMSVAIAGTFGAMGPFWTLPGRVFSPSQIAVGIAIVTTIGGIGNFISPPIVGYISVSTGSLAAAQLYFAALMLASASVVMITLRPRSAKMGGELQE
jgi:MFS family permease